MAYPLIIFTVSGLFLQCHPGRVCPQTNPISISLIYWPGSALTHCVRYIQYKGCTFQYCLPSSPKILGTDLPVWIHSQLSPTKWFPLMLLISASPDARCLLYCDQCVPFPISTLTPNHMMKPFHPALVLLCSSVVVEKRDKLSTKCCRFWFWVGNHEYSHIVCHTNFKMFSTPVD